MPFTVFVTGACVLVIEILATRILAPYFGNTIYSVSSVISVVLAALSAGYWFGGRLADRYPTKKLFFAIIAASGLLVLMMHTLQQSLLPLLGYRLPLDSGPLIISLLLFFVPSLVLGMLSPFAVALQQRECEKQGVGTTAGQIFFFSTLGSIAGSLLAGFALIPFFGIQAVIAGVGVVLFVLGIVPLAILGIERRFIVSLTLAAGGALLLVSLSAARSPGVVYDRDGLYEEIVITDGLYNGRPTRFLTQDTSNSAAMYLDSDELVYGYTRYYGLYEPFVLKPERVLALGGGAYSIPKALLADLPGTRVDVAEIEPSLVDLSKRYFNLKDDPRLTHFIKDGRRMLHDASQSYDVIFSDVYRSMYSIPAHFTTKEFMQLASDRLTDDGVFIANVIGSLRPQAPSFIWSEIKTLQQVFPQVYLFGVESPLEMETQNLIVVASKSKTRLSMDDPRWRGSRYRAVREASGHYVPIERMPLDGHRILTDDYAPVDYMTAQILPKR